MKRFGMSTVTVAGLLWVQGCVLISASFSPFGGQPEPLEETMVSGSGRAKVLVLDVAKFIGTQEEEQDFGLSHRPATTARVREQLEKAADDERVRAVVLRINSPGGTVTASDVIYHELMAFKAEHHVPVVAYMLDFGTSGAYYIALAADEIIASPTSVTGSVGVIMFGVNLSGLMDKLGLKNQTVKAGARKDVGSPLRPMTADDASLLQGVLDDLHERFVGLVRERRPGMGAEALRTIGDGRILTADQALQLGAIDRIGYFDDALAVAKQRAGVPEARVVLYRRPKEYAENIYSRAPGGPPQVNVVNLGLGAMPHAPQFLYLWTPSAESAVGLPALP